MVAETVWGIDGALFYSIMTLLWILLLAVAYYRRDKLSQRKFYAVLGMGVVWLVYSLFNLNHVALTAVPTAITLGIDVILGIAFLAGGYLALVKTWFAETD